MNQTGFRTADGAARLRAELGLFAEGSELAAELAGILASATVVNLPAAGRRGLRGICVPRRDGNEILRSLP